MSESKIKHLEMIQGIITRMGTNSFMLKGWAVTLVAGLFALADKKADQGFFLIAYMPTVLFWVLDSYYLLQERRFRVIYDIVRESKTDCNFSMKWNKATMNTDKTNWFSCFTSISEALFYLPLAAIIALVIAI